jgi:hypothetical protein
MARSAIIHGLRKGKYSHCIVLLCRLAHKLTPLNASPSPCLLNATKLPTPHSLSPGDVDHTAQRFTFHRGDARPLHIKKLLGSKIMPADVALASYDVPLPRTRITIFYSRDKKTTTCVFTDATYTWRSQVGSSTSLSFFLESQHGRAHDIASPERCVTCLHTAPLAAQKSSGNRRTTGR